MLTRIRQYVVCLLLPACTLPAMLQAQAPVINSVTPAAASVAKYDMFGLNIALTARYTNPYDYNDIAVRCVFTAPGGRKDTVDGFYMQDYTLSTINGNLRATGSGSFVVRYTPAETGAWQYVVSCTNTLGTATQPVQTFQCTAATAPGFIRKNASNYLGFDDAGQYIPIGENMCWPDKNAYTDYTKWLNKLADNKGNFIRLWMPSWGLGIEWKNGSGYGYYGLKGYNQQHAFYLDWLLSYCRQKGVYIMLSLDHHGQVSSTTDANWRDNPYNAANGGPCTNTWDFFTNAAARSLIKNRFRYIMARYGYSANIMCWELFNEVDWTDNFTAHRQDVSSWHSEMAAYLKSIDVYKHLVTTSYARDNYDPATWSLPNIDFTQTHYYVGSPNLESVLAAGSQNYLSAYHKPTLNGEFGIDASTTNLSVTDPSGVYIHNCLWATAFGGGMGPAASWWWDNYIDPQNLYTHFKPLSQVLAGIPLKDGNYKKLTASVSGPVAGDLSLSPLAAYMLAAADSSKIAGWVLNKQYNWKYLQGSGGTAPPVVSNATLSLPQVKNGVWRVQFTDCATGSITAAISAVATGHTLSIPLPSIAHDIAVTATFSHRK